MMRRSDLLVAFGIAHYGQVLDCPVCGKMFDKDKQQQYEEHVQQHFPEQVAQAAH